MSRKPAKSILILLALLIQFAYSGNLAFAQDSCISGGDQSFILMAGQHMEVGTVDVMMVSEAPVDHQKEGYTGNYLKVTYDTADSGWELMATHLWVGIDMTTMPQTGGKNTNNGNPKVGHFPYGHSGDGTTSYSHYIPLDTEDLEDFDLGFTCPNDDALFYMSAYALVMDTNGVTEGAWSDPKIWMQNGGNWIRYSTFTLSCNCDGGGGGDNCETAFAYGGSHVESDGHMDDHDYDDDDVNSVSTCFLDSELELKANRWGWSIGPLSEGIYEFDIYAAAGQCLLDKGTLVGYLDVDISTDNTSTEVMFNYVLDTDFTLDQVHFYAGCGDGEKLPSNESGQYTVAPGQYGYNYDPEEATHSGVFILDPCDVNDGIYVIAHANVCEVEEEVE